MNVLEAKACVQKYLSSITAKKELTPDSIAKMVQANTKIYLGDDSETTASPRMGYINSNIKGVYYIIYCDSCNSRCRKVFPRELNINGTKVLKFLCGKCAGVKYARKSISEKRALEYLLHPEKLMTLDVRNLSLKEDLAILEARFMEDAIKERAERNVSKYTGFN